MNDKPSLLIIGNFLSETSGVRGVCEDLADRMMNAGWTIVKTSTKPGRIARLLDMLITVWIRRSEYQLASIDTFSNWSFLWAEFVAFVLTKIGKTYILVLRGGGLPEFAQRWPVRVTRLLGSAGVVIVPSRFLLEKMRPYCSKLVLVPNPIDISKYTFFLRGKRLQSESGPTLMWLRAFHDIYNAPLAIYVTALLISQYPKFRLIMGGGAKNDDSFQKVKQLAEALEVSGFIEFSGKVPKTEIPSWLQMGEIFINTANVDNTPVTVMEAMACGLPVVSTNVGGIPYLLEDEKDALLVPPDNPEAMARAVNRILTEPGLSTRLSRNARKKTEHFDWSVILPQWERVIKQVARTK